MPGVDQVLPDAAAALGCFPEQQAASVALADPFRGNLLLLELALDLDCPLEGVLQRDQELVRVVARERIEEEQVAGIVHERLDPAGPLLAVVLLRARPLRYPLPGRLDDLEAVDIRVAPLVIDLPEPCSGGVGQFEQRLAVSGGSDADILRADLIEVDRGAVAIARALLFLGRDAATSQGAHRGLREQALLVARVGAVEASAAVAEIAVVLFAGMRAAAAFAERGRLPLETFGGDDGVLDAVAAALVVDQVAGAEFGQAEEARAGDVLRRVAHIDRDADG